MNDKLGKYLQLAQFQASLFSKDPNTKVACILLDPESYSIHATGFNGLPRSCKELPERLERPLKYTWTVHAEANAICNAARSGACIKGSTAVVTLYPCVECAKMLIQSGIKTIVAPTPDYELPKWGEQFKISSEMFSEAAIDTVLF